jgi:hypothetical protein
METETEMGVILYKSECYAWEITRMRRGSDEGDPSPVTPPLAVEVQPPPDYFWIQREVLLE